MQVDHDYADQDAVAASLTTSLYRTAARSNGARLPAATATCSTASAGVGGNAHQEQAAVAAGAAMLQRVMRVIVEGPLGRMVKVGTGAAGVSLWRVLWGVVQVGAGAAGVLQTRISV